MLSILNKYFFRGLSQKVCARSYGGAVIDPQQELALKENCILVDQNDKPLGASSKYDCHRVNKKTGDLKLHRAFSVCLFNTNGEILLQRRSSRKITYPDTYTNTCCSHPLYDIDGEREEDNEIGVRRAVQRRLNYELGIPKDQVPPECFQYITRIHYKDEGDGVWGEHEIDYIFFLKKDVDLYPNKNEVSDLCYIKRSEIDEAVKHFNAPLTPWFKLILKHKLKEWWDNLDTLDKCVDKKNIIRFQ